ncbi:hypothetical protein ACFP81_08825 [Deinococcus lacus]|uniref:Lipoprotein n=1 Tax=Deinococcus lacus TaxID=392561 RepID=A0ABW1YCY4_9DEIO
MRAYLLPLALLGLCACSPPAPQAQPQAAQASQASGRCLPPPSFATVNLATYPSLPQLEAAADAIALIQPERQSYDAAAQSWATFGRVLKVYKDPAGRLGRDGDEVRFHDGGAPGNPDDGRRAEGPFAPVLAFLKPSGQGERLYALDWVCRTGAGELVQGGANGDAAAQAAAVKYGL